MPEVTNDLIYEILKKLQLDTSQIKATLADHSHQLVRIREDLNDLRRDDLRHETMQAQMDNRLERIEARLSLSDAQ